MKLVFADTFYLIARLNKRDPYHARTMELSGSLRASIMTSDWVLAEVANTFANSAFRLQMRDYIGMWRTSPACRIIPASRELFDRALESYHRHSDKGWSLTDCTSFILMRDHGIDEALTGDRHFEQAGFTALLK